MNNMVKLKINDSDVEVPKGTTVLEAARTIGIEIPHFCYHPSLSLVGSCRMCQVEFIAGERRFLGVSCRTEVSEGMQVQTHSDGAVRARAGVLEFLLADHPLDCPICDKAGECPLQNYSYEHGFTDSRFEEMRRKGMKKTPLGGHIVFDSERCILCTRCERFMTEFAKAPQLTVASRGDHSYIATFPGHKLDSEYTGNLADICPVGALTLDEFRFQCRVWNLASTPSICPYCSRGCNISVDVRKGHREVLRIVPRFNEAVHGHYICNEGRFRPLEVDRVERLQTALAEGRETTLDAVLGDVAARLKALEGGILVVTSVQRSSEEIFVTKEIFDALAKDRIVALKPEVEKPDGILRTGERGANVRFCKELGIPLITTQEMMDLLTGGDVKALVLTDPGLTLSSELVSRLELMVYLGHVDNETARAAHAAIPGRTWVEKEGTYINFQGRIQRFFPAAAPPSPAILPDLVTLVRLGRQLGIQNLPDDTAEVFNTITSRLDGFQGLTYADIGSQGILLLDEDGGES